MSNNNIYKEFEQVYSYWLDELAKYSDNQLEFNIDSESWTIGQLYMHLINSTLNFHLKQVGVCISSSENRKGRKSFKGIYCFIFLKKFPPIKIKVPPSEAYTPKQPESKAIIVAGFQNVKEEMEKILSQFKNNKNGKTPHPTFSFLNADEWYKLVLMHWNHHILQKERIDKIMNQ